MSSRGDVFRLSQADGIDCVAGRVGRIGVRRAAERSLDSHRSGYRMCGHHPRGVRTARHPGASPGGRTSRDVTGRASSATRGRFARGPARTSPASQSRGIPGASLRGIPREVRTARHRQNKFCDRGKTGGPPYRKSRRGRKPFRREYKKELNWKRGRKKEFPLQKYQRRSNSGRDRSRSPKGEGRPEAKK